MHDGPSLPICVVIPCAFPPLSPLPRPHTPAPPPALCFHLCTFQDASLLHTLSGPAHRITSLTLANTAAPRGASTPINYGHLLVCGDYGGSFHVWDLSHSLPPPHHSHHHSHPPALAPTHPFLPPTVSSSLPSTPLPSCPSFLVPSAPPLPTNPTHPTSTPHLVTTSVTAPVPAPHLVTTSVTAPVPAPCLVTTWSEEKDWRYSGVLSLAAPQPGDYNDDDGGAAAAAGDFVASSLVQHISIPVVHCSPPLIHLPCPPPPPPPLVAPFLSSPPTFPFPRFPFPPLPPLPPSSSNPPFPTHPPQGSYSLLARMEGHTAPVSSLQVDSQVAVSGSWDGTVRLWWRPDHSPMAVLVCSSPNTSTRALGSSTGMGQGPGMGGQGMGASLGVSVGASVSVRAVVVDEEGDLILCAREDGRVEVWHGSSSIMLLTPTHAMPVTATSSATTTTTTTDALSPPPALLSLAVCRPLLAAGAADGSIMVWTDVRCCGVWCCGVWCCGYVVVWGVVVRGVVVWIMLSFLISYHLWHMHGYAADVSITPWRRLSHAHPQSHIQGPCTALAFALSDAAAAAAVATEVTTGHGSSGWRDDLAASLLLLSGGFDGRLCVWEGKVAGSITGRV
ncbi:unnamed protein product [Closterium sp. NIES-54]